MRGNSLFGSLAFGLLAALGSIPWTMVCGPILGRLWALAIYSLAMVALYVVVIAPNWSRGVAIGGLAVGLAGVAGLLAPWPAEAIFGAALILAIARSGFLYRQAPARALALEGALAIGGLLFAYAVAGPTLLGAALAIWSFFLVQSLYFLVGGRRDRVSDEPAVDPFEKARQRALALMDSGRFLSSSRDSTKG